MDWRSLVGPVVCAFSLPVHILVRQSWNVTIVSHAHCGEAEASGFSVWWLIGSAALAALGVVVARPTPIAGVARQGQIRYGVVSRPAVRRALRP